MLHAQLAALVLAATTLAASGCGGSSKTTSTASTAAATTTTATTTAQTTAPTVTTAEEIKIQSGTPLSRAVWISRGDAICAVTNAKRKSTTVRTVADFARLLPQVAAYDHTEAIELSKLVPPPNMAADWTQIVTELQKFGEFTAKVGVYAQEKRFTEGEPLLRTANTLQRELTTVARRDGFKKCSIQ